MAWQFNPFTATLDYYETGSGGVSDGDKGDITVSGSGATWTIDNEAVTLAKQANVATGTVFYRKTAGTGVPEVQTLATLKTDLGLTGTNSGDQGIYTERATQALSASTAITVTDGSPITPITSSGAITSTAAPLIAAGRDGQLCILRNDNGPQASTITVSDTNYLANSNLRLTADTLALAVGSVLGLVYSATQGAWMQIYYLAPKFYTGAINTFTINIGAGAANSQNAEVGTGTTDTPTFAWTYTGIPSAGTVDVSAGGDAGTDYPATILTPFASLVGAAYNKGTSVGAVRTFTPTITVNGVALSTPTATVTYINKRYIGTSTTGTQLNDTQIKALSTNELNTSQYSSWAVTAGASDYIWVCLRSALTDPFFAIAGCRAGFSPSDNDLPAYAAVSHTNASSFAENYDLWRSYATNLGSVTVTTQNSAAANLRYWLATTSTGDLNDATVNAAGTTDLLTSNPISKTIAATGSNYAYMIYPSRLTTMTYISANGYIAGVVDEGTSAHRNVYGYTETYRQLRTANAGLGNTSYTFTTTLPVNKTYGGPVNQNTALSSAQTIALDDAATGSYNTTGAKYSSVTITTAAGEYAWYCYRSTYGATSMNFGIDSERAGFTRVGTGTVSVTNEQGYVETFEQWCSNITNPTRGANRTITAQSSAFNNRVYMGPHADTDPITTAHILTLDDAATGTSSLASTVAGSYTVTIGTGKYLWFCHPDSIADLATIKDHTTGFGIDGAYMTDVSHTNDSGYTETYRCWRSTNPAIFPSANQVDVT